MADKSMSLIAEFNELKTRVEVLAELDKQHGIEKAALVAGNVALTEERDALKVKLAEIEKTAMDQVAALELSKKDVEAKAEATAKELAEAKQKLELAPMKDVSDGQKEISVGASAAADVKESIIERINKLSGAAKMAEYAKHKAEYDAEFAKR